MLKKFSNRLAFMRGLIFALFLTIFMPPFSSLGISIINGSNAKPNAIPFSHWIFNGTAYSMPSTKTDFGIFDFLNQNGFEFMTGFFSFMTYLLTVLMAGLLIGMILSFAKKTRRLGAFVATGSAALYGLANLGIAIYMFAINSQYSAAIASAQANAEPLAQAVDKKYLTTALANLSSGVPFGAWFGVIMGALVCLFGVLFLVKGQPPVAEGVEKKTVGRLLIDYALYIVLGLMIMAVIVYAPAFVTVQNITNILSQASTRIIMALGTAGLIVLAGTDLSAGRIVGLCGVVTASLLQSLDYAARMYEGLPYLGLILPFVISMAIGLIFAAINGFGVAVLKLHAFIITLGTQLIAYGVSCIYIDRPPRGAQPIANLDKRYTEFVTGSIKLGSGDDQIGIPYLIFYALICAIIIWFVWNKTRLGKNMFAIGGNPEAAAVSGVSLTKNIMYVFLISGAMYGVAGFLESGRVGSATSALGANYELDAIAACVVGGVSFSGGIGTVPGVLIGAVLLQFINYGLTFVSINPYLQYIIKGIIIVFAVSIDVRKYISKK